MGGWIRYIGYAKRCLLFHLINWGHFLKRKSILSHKVKPDWEPAAAPPAQLLSLPGPGFSKNGNTVLSDLADLDVTQKFNRRSIDCRKRQTCRKAGTQSYGSKRHILSSPYDRRAACWNTFIKLLFFPANGKPVERQGRKVTGLSGTPWKSRPPYDRRAAWIVAFSTTPWSSPSPGSFIFTEGSHLKN